jgi:hypothetical protein
MVQARFQSEGFRVIRQLVFGTILVVAAIPPLLVFLDQWLDENRAADLFAQWWLKSGLSAHLALPAYFLLILILTFANILLLWTQSAPASSEEADNATVPTEQNVPTPQRRRAALLIAGALVGILLNGVHQFVFAAMPGWELALLFLIFLLGWILYEFPREQIAEWWVRYRGGFALFVLSQICVLLLLDGFYSTRGFGFLSLLLIFGAGLVMWHYRRRVYPAIWLTLLALVLFTLRIDTWQFSIIGDEFSFYSYAHEIADKFDLGFILSHIFWGTAVYEQEPFLGTLYQSLMMRAFDLQNFGWRISSIYASALSLIFFYYFFRTFKSNWIAFTATAFLSVSEYLMNFSKIAYDNTTALLAMSMALAGASFAIRHPRRSAFVIAGAAFSLCVYVFPAANFVPVIAGLLLLIYRPPLSKQAWVRWGLLALTALILLSPLFTQTKFWFSKLHGTFASNTQFTNNSNAMWENVRVNLVYAFYSFLYIGHESHFVTVGYGDILTAGLALLGLAVQIRLSARQKFAFYSVLSFIIFIILIGATHGSTFPPVTRMFLLLPFFTLFAAVALEWLVAQARELNLASVRPQYIGALVLLAALALNLYQANIIAVPRSANYQNISNLTLGFMQNAVVVDPGSKHQLVVLNDPDMLWVPGVQELLQLNYITTPVVELKARETSPDAVRNTLLNPSALVLVNPRLPSDVINEYQSYLTDNSWIPCQLVTTTGQPITNIWLPPDTAVPCPAGSPPNPVMYRWSRSQQLLPLDADPPLSVVTALAIMFIAALLLARHLDQIPTGSRGEYVRALLQRVAPRPIFQLTPHAKRGVPTVPAKEELSNAAFSREGSIPRPSKSSLHLTRVEGRPGVQIELSLRITIGYPPARNSQVNSVITSPAPAQELAATVIKPSATEQSMTAQIATQPAPRWQLPRIMVPRLAPAMPIGIPILRWWVLVGEWGFLAAVVTVFCLKFLDMSPNRILFGNEYEVFASLDFVVMNSLRALGQFPLWNFFIRTGQPLMADPFLHIYNPVSTLPILIWGVVNGFKIGILLSFILAAIGQWLLAWTLGLNRVARIWTALLYSFNGQAPAHFLQGQYDFALGYAWIPFVFAGVVLVLRTRQRKYVVLTAFAATFLFFSGNVYYSFFMALVLALLTIGILIIIGVFRNKGSDWRALTPLPAVAILVVGLTALQFLPMLEFWPHFSKQGDPELRTSQPLPEIIEDFVSTSPDRPSARDVLAPYDYYGYIGLVPFLGAALAMGAWWRGWRKEILAFSALFLITTLWIAARYTPFAPIYAKTPWLYQFRFPSRMLIFAACAVITVGGIGFTWLTQQLATWRKRSTAATLAGAALLLVGVVLAYSIFDVAQANSRFLALSDYSLENDRIIKFLNDSDPNLKYVAIPYSTGWHQAVVSNNEHLFRAWYGFDFFPPIPDTGKQPAVIARPNYVIVPKDRQPLDDAGHVIQNAQRVKEFQFDALYRLPDSLPYAFAVDDPALSEATRLRADDVQALDVKQTGANTLMVTANISGEGKWVTALTSYYPGWRVFVDRRETARDEFEECWRVPRRPSRSGRAHVCLSIRSAQLQDWLDYHAAVFSCLSRDPLQGRRANPLARPSARAWFGSAAAD